MKSCVPCDIIASHPFLTIQDPDMDVFSGVLSQTRSISYLLTSYSTLQAFLIIGLIIQLISEWSFQARLSLIYSTLLSAFGALYHLVVVIICIVPMVAVMANTLMGQRLQAVSNISGALQDTFLAILGASTVQQQHRFGPPSIETLGDLILLLTEVLLVLHILLSFFFCILVQVGGWGKQIKANHLSW